MVKLMLVAPEGAVGRFSAIACDGAITGRSSGVKTTRSPLRNWKSSDSKVVAAPLVVAGVVSFARAVTVAAASPLFIFAGVTAEPPEPAVTVAGRRTSLIGLASHAVSVRWLPSIRWILNAILAVAVT